MYREFFNGVLREISSYIYKKLVVQVETCFQDLVARNIDDNMKEYCANRDSCRRNMILKHFDRRFTQDSNASLCSCCDVCERKCVCVICSAGNMQCCYNMLIVATLSQYLHYF